MKIVQVVLRHKREICTVGVALGIVGVMTGCEKKTQEAPILAQADLVIYAVQEPSVYEPVIKEFEERTNLVVDVCIGTTEELKQMHEHDRQKEKTGRWVNTGMMVLFSRCVKSRRIIRFRKVIRNSRKLWTGIWYLAQG